MVFTRIIKDSLKELKETTSLHHRLSLLSQICMDTKSHSVATLLKIQIHFFKFKLLGADRGLLSWFNQAHVQFVLNRGAHSWVRFWRPLKGPGFRSMLWDEHEPLQARSRTPTLDLQNTSKGHDVTSQDCAVERLRQLPEVSVYVTGICSRGTHPSHCVFQSQVHHAVSELFVWTPPLHYCILPHVRAEGKESSVPGWTVQNL